jgi:hypothetical protein
MTFPLTQQRLWGALLMVGGLLLAVGYVLYPSSSGPDVIIPASKLIFVGVPCAVMGLVGFQIAQSGRAGTLGWVGAALTGLGIVLVSNSAILSLANRHALDDTDAYHSSIAGGYEFYGIVAVSLGLVELTVATFRSGLHPRWVAWLLVANLALTVVSQVVGPLGTALHTPAPNYLMMALLGLAAFTRQPDPADDISPAPVLTTAS